MSPAYLLHLGTPLPYHTLTPSRLHTHTNTAHRHTSTPLKRTPQCGSPCGPPLSTRRTRRAPRQSRGFCDRGRVWQEDRGSGSKPCGPCHRPQTLRWCPCGKSRAQGVGAMRTLGAGQLGGEHGYRSTRYKLQYSNIRT